MPDSRYIAKVRRRKTFWNNVTRVVIQLFVWTGAAVLYYFAFSIFFDTPVEYRLKHSTDRLRREYATLTGRYDSLNRVMENVIARDRNVFHILFEADPYDFEEENAANRWNFYEGLLSQSTIELQKQSPIWRTPTTAWQRRSTAAPTATGYRPSSRSSTSS